MPNPSDFLLPGTARQLEDTRPGHHIQSFTTVVPRHTTWPNILPCLGLLRNKKKLINH